MNIFKRKKQPELTEAQKKFNKLWDMYANLNTAFKSYGTKDEESICEKADEYYYEHEQEIANILQNYANTLNL
ncbi:MAG: hypothetical protein J5852_04950 [Clostridia bacterium]|nr:hypothetical protein [Clostridia bacterium]